jgi:hypothetical protein
VKIKIPKYSLSRNTWIFSVWKYLNILWTNVDLPPGPVGTLVYQYPVLGPFQLVAQSYRYNLSIKTATNNAVFFFFKIVLKATFQNLVRILRRIELESVQIDFPYYQKAWSHQTKSLRHKQHEVLCVENDAESIKSLLLLILLIISAQYHYTGSFDTLLNSNTDYRKSWTWIQIQ